MAHKRHRRYPPGFVESSEIDLFLEEVLVVCEKHGMMMISHEDGHGSFRVVDFYDGDDGWIFDAVDCRKDASK